MFHGETTHRLFVYSVHQRQSGRLGGHTLHTSDNGAHHALPTNQRRYVHEGDENASSSVGYMFMRPPLTLPFTFLIFHSRVQARLGFPFLIFLHAFRTLRSIFLLCIHFSVVFQNRGNVGLIRWLQYHRRWRWRWRRRWRQHMLRFCTVGRLSHFESGTMNDVIAADGLHATNVP